MNSKLKVQPVNDKSAKCLSLLGVCMRVGGTVSNTSQGSDTKKKEGETKILKRGAS